MCLSSAQGSRALAILSLSHSMCIVYVKHDVAYGMLLTTNVRGGDAFTISTTV